MLQSLLIALEQLVRIFAVYAAVAMDELGKVSETAAIGFPLASCTPVVTINR